MATSRVAAAPIGRRTAPARRMRDIVRARILSGVYGAGPLPTDAQLAADFGTSRNVVREVLSALRVEGLIARLQGVGTFVVSDKAVQGLDQLQGLAETFQTGRDRVVNRVVLAETVPANPMVAERLGLSPGAEVVALERVRMLDGSPLSLDTTYLPADIGAPLLRFDLARHDVFRLIEAELGLPLGEATVTIEAIAADAAVAALLDVTEGSPLLFIERLTFTECGRPADLEFVRYRGDRLSLAGRLQRVPTSNPHPPAHERS